MGDLAKFLRLNVDKRRGFIIWNFISLIDKATFFAEDIRRRTKSSITGRPMERAGIKKLRTIIAERVKRP